MLRSYSVRVIYHIRVELRDESRNLRVGTEQLQPSVAELLHSHDIALNNRFARDVDVIELNLDERFESRFNDQPLLP